MYSDKQLRLLIAVILTLGLIPIVLAGLQSGKSEMHSTLFNIYLGAVFIGTIFAVAMTVIIFKMGGIPISPIWLNIFGIIALYVFCTTVASFVPFVGFLVLMVMGWGLSTWLLELPSLIGAFVGIIFFAARIVGNLLSALISITSG